MTFTEIFGAGPVTAPAITGAGRFSYRTGRAKNAAMWSSGSSARLPGRRFQQGRLKDLFCSVGADRGSAMKSNALYIQQPDHTFADQAYQWNVPDTTSRGRYGAVLDANHDGYPDIFYGAESLRPDGLPSIAPPAR